MCDIYPIDWDMTIYGVLKRNGTFWQASGRMSGSPVQRARLSYFDGCTERFFWTNYAFYS
jgi:hypothetical protein